MTDYDELIRTHNEQAARDSELYSETLESMRDMMLDEERVVDLFENADKVILEINDDFKKATGLNKIDVRFLMLATALQITRWAIIALINRAISEKISDSRKENNDASIKNREKAQEQQFLDKHKEKLNSREGGLIKSKHRSARAIITDSVPYDITRGCTPFAKGAGGPDHRMHTLGHDPVLGWVFGTMNILSDTITLDQRYSFRTFDVQMTTTPKMWTGITSIPEAFYETVDSVKEDELRLIAAVAKQAIHLESDKYTKLGLPVPGLETVSSDLAEWLYNKVEKNGKIIKEGYDTLLLEKDIKIVGAQAVLAIIINLIIACIHELFYDPAEYKNHDLYEVKTRKILSISNAIASASNVIWVSCNAVAGNEKALADLDIGGILVTAYRLIVDIRFISKVQKEYLESEWMRRVASTEFKFTLETNMSKKDMEKGLIIQAKADAAAHEKVATRLAQHADKLEQIKDSQQDLHNTVGIVLEDMRDMQIQEKYGISRNRLPRDLPRNEKLVLCTALFSLVDSEDEINELQRQLFLSIESQTGTRNRQPGFDFFKLANIDSKSDRKVVLEAICSFLFLKTNDFSFLDDETYSWLQDSAISNDIEDVREIIEREYSKLGPEGIASRYPVAQTESTSEPEPDAPDESEVEIESQVAYAEEKSDEPFDELKGIILSFVRDETAFGKSRSDSPKQVIKEISKRFPKLAPESFVYASRVEEGYLLFTTHAIYLKADPVPKNSYARIPYSSICANELSWELGKIKGTKKLKIPVLLNTGKKIPYAIDDTKIEEEKLRDLIKAIAESKCAIADTDLSTDISHLNENEKILYFKALGNILTHGRYCLTELFLLVADCGLRDKWNEIAEGFADDGALDGYVSEFLSGIPYPSQSAISLEALLLSLQTICRTNFIIGNPESSITDEIEQLVCKFDTRAFDSKYFNKVLGQASESRRIITIDTISDIKKNLPKDLLYYDRVKEGISTLEIEARMYEQEDVGMDDMIFGLKRDFEDFLINLIGGEDEEQGPL